MATAVDEYAWTVNNVLEWYAMYFSPEVIAVQDDMLLGAGQPGKPVLGTNIGFAKADVDAATRSIFARYDEVDGRLFPGDCRLSSRHSGAASDPPGPGDRRNRGHDRAGTTAGLTITGTRQTLGSPLETLKNRLLQGSGLNGFCSSLHVSIVIPNQGTFRGTTANRSYRCQRSGRSVCKGVGEGHILLLPGPGNGYTLTIRMRWPSPSRSG